MVALHNVTAGIKALAQAASVVRAGAPEGFAASVTGGGSAPPVTPTTNDELVSYLTDNQPRVIVLTKTFDFNGIEGVEKENGCAPWGTGPGCQTAINRFNWCTNYESGAEIAPVAYDKAGLVAIEVASRKTIVGSGALGVIKGKGFRLSNGVNNVIIQNIRFTDINPQCVWGGDAITLAGTDLIWIDHVTIDHIGRHHIVTGPRPSGRVSITNNHLDGATEFSATCDGYHYWSMDLTGSADKITFKNNYISHFSGRAPKLGGGTLFHAVNNYWHDAGAKGHAFEVGKGAYILAEGNLFGDVPAIYDPGLSTTAYVVNDPTMEAACASKLGRNCVSNVYSNSGAWKMSDTSVLSKFAPTDTIAVAGPVEPLAGLASSAGYGTMKR